MASPASLCLIRGLESPLKSMIVNACQSSLMSLVMSKLDRKTIWVDCFVSGFPG